MRVAHILELIDVAAMRSDLEVNLVTAIASVESLFDPSHEEHVNEFCDLVDPEKYATALDIPVRAERWAQRTRLGVMGILGGMARKHGYEKDLDMLLIPKENIYLGCEVLKTLFRRYESEDAVILAWRGYSVLLPPKIQPKNEREFLIKVKKKLVALRAIDR